MGDDKSEINKYFTPVRDFFGPKGLADSVFLVILLFSFSMWMFDMQKTRTDIWVYGTQIELNPTVRQIYETHTSQHAFMLFTGQIVFMHVVTWVMYRFLPVIGWIMLMGGLVVTFQTLLFNFGVL